MPFVRDRVIFSGRCGERVIEKKVVRDLGILLRGKKRGCRGGDGLKERAKEFAVKMCTRISLTG